MGVIDIHRHSPRLDPAMCITYLILRTSHHHDLLPQFQLFWICSSTVLEFCLEPSRNPITRDIKHTITIGCELDKSTQFSQSIQQYFTSTAAKHKAKGSNPFSLPSSYLHIIILQRRLLGHHILQQHRSTRFAEHHQSNCSMCGSTSKNKSSSEELVTEGGADNTIKKSMAATMVHVSCDGSTNKKSFSNELVTNVRTTKHDYSSRSPDLSRQFAPGINAEGYPVKHTLRTQYDHQQPSKEKDPLLIGIRGKWYDVASFVQHHPGGDILLDFVGRDATSEFIAYHDETTVLKHRKPVGTYDYTPADAMDAEWLALNDKYEKLGYFETPLWFVWSRLAILLGFGIASLVCVRWHLHSPNWLVLMTGAACLAGVWQQSGAYVDSILTERESI